MPKDTDDDLPAYRHGADNSKLIEAIRVLAAGKRQFITKLGNNRRYNLVNINGTNITKLGKYVTDQIKIRKDARTNGTVPFPKGETPDIANLKAIHDDLTKNGNTPEYYERYKGECIFLNFEGDPETIEDTKIRRELFAKIEKAIPKRERIHFPDWMLNDTNYIFNRIVENDRALKAEIDDVVHRVWARLELRKTGNPIKDWAGFYDSYGNCLLEFERVKDAPAIDRHVRKLEEILLKDSRFSNVIQTKMAGGTWGANTGLQLVKLLTDLDDLFRKMYGRLENLPVANNATASTGAVANISTGDSSALKPICEFHAKGKCKYGDKI